MKETGKYHKNILVAGPSLHIIDTDEKRQNKNSHLEKDGFLVLVNSPQKSADSSKKDDVKNFQFHEKIISLTPVSLETAINKLFM